MAGTHPLQHTWVLWEHKQVSKVCLSGYNLPRHSFYSSHGQF
jgi:hypothetical protein